VEQLKSAGFIFYPWSGEELPLVRLVTSFDMPQETVDKFLTVAKAAASQLA
jgi:threonine aldolase